jgi:hypothetical protein
MCAFVPVLFAIELVDMQLDHRLDQGRRHQAARISGLDGIVFAPLLHASFEHLLANSVPLILMGTFVLAAGAVRFLLSHRADRGRSAASASGSSARSGRVTVGASGVIFGYLGVLLMRGLVERSWWNIAVGVLIALLYGWQLIGVLPTDERISWQATCSVHRRADRRDRVPPPAAARAARAARPGGVRCVTARAARAEPVEVELRARVPFRPLAWYRSAHAT